MMINKRINQLIHYGLLNGLLEEDDKFYAVNRIIKLLDITSFTWEDTEENDFFEIIEDILDYAVKHNILVNPSINDLDAFEALIVDCLLPRPSELNQIFQKKYKIGPLTATNWFHQFSVLTNYIKTKRIEKNIRYEYIGKYAPLEITINLSKPEKDPMDIKKQNQDKSKYPICPLCMENVGVYQSTSLAPRSNHRVISINLNHEVHKWGIQYSPYAYFDEHLIVLRKEHSPMYVNHQTFAELVDFINKFPHYLIGSNAGLPIVGGSILSHHHFQGGKHHFPIEDALVLASFKRRKVEIEVLDWPMAAIKLISNNENHLLDMAEQVFDFWQGYSNPDLQIFAKTKEAHNTVTPIIKLDGSKYNMYIIFRNNYTTDDLPYGMYHPDPKRFHIKKENIGLIEVMGMAILPGRLLNELEMIKSVVLDKNNISDYPELEKHKEWILEIKEEADIKNLDHYLRQSVGQIFEKVLEDCNVFKHGTNQDFIDFVNKAIY